MFKKISPTFKFFLITCFCIINNITRSVENVLCTEKSSPDKYFSHIKKKKNTLVESIRERSRKAMFGHTFSRLPYELGDQH